MPLRPDKDVGSSPEVGFRKPARTFMRQVLANAISEICLNSQKQPFDLSRMSVTQAWITGGRKPSYFLLAIAQRRSTHPAPTISVMANVCAKFLHWLRDQIVQDVPEALEYAEFHCRKPQCTAGIDCTCDVKQQGVQSNCSNLAGDPNVDRSNVLKTVDKLTTLS